jgi:ATP-dependent exoDNAse (exonuclease V) beta subunit
LPKLQIHSATQTYSEFLEFSWFYAILIVLLNPQNQFEFSGILREIFGISDINIARHFLKHDVQKIITIEQFFNNIRPKCFTSTPLQIIDLIFQEFELKERIIAIRGKFLYEMRKELQLIALESYCGVDFLFHLQQKAEEIYQSLWIDEDAIQLYTFHKAKGLEWPIVIIPFINRKQSPAPRTFPTVVNGKITINKRQYEEWSDTYSNENNMERLLYVALTRQKKQTIFINDGYSAGNHSIVAILEKPEQNKNFLQSLPFYK